MKKNLLFIILCFPLFSTFTSCGDSYYEENPFSDKNISEQYELCNPVTFLRNYTPISYIPNLKNLSSEESDLVIEKIKNNKSSKLHKYLYVRHASDINGEYHHVNSIAFYNNRCDEYVKSNDGFTYGCGMSTILRLGDKDFDLLYGDADHYSYYDVQNVYEKYNSIYDYYLVRELKHYCRLESGSAVWNPPYPTIKPNAFDGCFQTHYGYIFYASSGLFERRYEYNFDYQLIKMCSFETPPDGKNTVEFCTYYFQYSDEIVDVDISKLIEVVNSSTYLYSEGVSIKNGHIELDEDHKDEIDVDSSYFNIVEEAKTSDGFIFRDSTITFNTSLSITFPDDSSYNSVLLSFELKIKGLFNGLPISKSICIEYNDDNGGYVSNGFVFMTKDNKPAYVAEGSSILGFWCEFIVDDGGRLELSRYSISAYRPHYI